MVSVLVSEWRKIVKDVDAWGFSGVIGYYCDIYWLVGLNRFRFTNFMESGIDVTFRIDGTNFDASNPSTWQGYLTPLDNYEVRSTDSGYLYWYLYDDVNDCRPVWTVASGRLQNGNICFRARLESCEVNIVDGGVDGYQECHGLIQKVNGGSDWVSFDYTDDQINLDGFTD